MTRVLAFFVGRVTGGSLMTQQSPAPGLVDTNSSIIVIASVAQQKAKLRLAEPEPVEKVPDFMRIEPMTDGATTVKDVWAKPRATKTNCLDGGKMKLADYNAGTLFRFSEHKVASLKEVAQLLQEQAANLSHGNFVVTGQLTEYARNNPGKRLHRRSDLRKYGQDGVSLMTAASHLLILDLDDATVPNWNPLDPEPGVNWICEKLGAGFAHADVLLQITGSQSLTPGALARIRLYFFLHEPWSLGEQRGLINELKAAHPSLKLDTATTALGQPIYIAPPLYVGERSPEAIYNPWQHQVADPITNRWFLFKRCGVLLQEKPQQQVAYNYLPSGRTGHGLNAGVVMIKSRDPGYELDALLEHEDQVHAKILDATFNFARHNRELLTSKVVESVHKGLIHLCTDGPLKHRADRIHGADVVAEIERAYVSAWARIHGRRVDAPALEQLSAQEGGQAVQDAVREFFNGNTKRLAIHATMGLGKSAAVIHQAIAADVRVDLYVPDLALAAEMAMKITTLGSTSIVVKGRLALVDPSKANDTTAERMCQKWQSIEIAQQIADSPLGADQLCRKSLGHGNFIHCPHYKRCAYVAQFLEVPQNTQFVIRAHDYLGYEASHLDTELNSIVGRPKFNVVDEDPLSRLLQKSTYDLARLRMQAEQEGFFFDRPLYAILDSLSRGQDAVAGFLGAVVGREKLDCDDHDDWMQAQDVMRELIAHVGQSFFWFDPTLSASEALLRAQNGLRVNLWRKILQEIQETLDARQCQNNRIWSERQNGMLVVKVTKALTAIRVASRRVPLLLLDGSADLMGLRQVFGDLEVRHVNVRRNARIIQVVDRSFSDTALRGDSARLSDLAGLAKLLRSTNTPGVVARKSIENLFLSADIPTLHHGKLRGQNALEQCDVLLVIGRMQPPPGAMEEQARALYPFENLNLPGFYQRGAASYRISSNELQEVQERQWLHPDPRVAARLQQSRENELAQAIDRARLVHSSVRKLVLLFTNQPVSQELEVDLMPLVDVLGPNGLMGLLAAHDGFLPLNWRWLQAQHPEQFPNEARVKDFAQRCRSWAEKTPLGLVQLKQDRQSGARGRAGHAVQWLGAIHSREVPTDLSEMVGSPNKIY